MVELLFIQTYFPLRIFLRGTSWGEGTTNLDSTQTHHMIQKSNTTSTTDHSEIPQAAYVQHHPKQKDYLTKPHTPILCTPRLPDKNDQPEATLQGECTACNNKKLKPKVKRKAHGSSRVIWLLWGIPGRLLVCTKRPVCWAKEHPIRPPLTNTDIEYSASMKESENIKFPLTRIRWAEHLGQQANIQSYLIVVRQFAKL